MEGTTIVIEAEQRSTREKLGDAYSTIERAMITARKAARTANDDELLAEVKNILKKARVKGDKYWDFI